MTTAEIKEKIKKSRIYQYEIAAELGITEYTLCKWFRVEMSPDRQEKVLAAIEAVKSR